MVVPRRPPAPRWLLVLLAVSALHTSAWAQKTPAAPATPEAKEARTLFDRGMSLSQESKWAEALEAFEKANKLNPQPVIQYNIAFNLRALGRYVEAKQRLIALIESTKDAKPPLKAALKSDIDQLFTEVKEKVVQLRISIDPPDAELQIDGTPARLPADGAIELDPGKHVFVLKKEGYDTTSSSKTLSSADTELKLRAPKTRVETVEVVKTVEKPVDKPFYTRFWFWTATSVAIVGGAAVVYLVTRPEAAPQPDKPPASTIDRILPAAVRF